MHDHAVAIAVVTGNPKTIFLVGPDVFDHFLTSVHWRADHRVPGSVTDN